VFATTLSDAYVRRLLADPAVLAALPHALGEVHAIEAQENRPRVLAVRAGEGDFILRFPADEAGLATLLKEEAVQRALHPRVTLRIPDTAVIRPAPDTGLPCFAIHTLIAGGDLSTAAYLGMSTACRDRLTDDLATFFCQTHAVPLAEACVWLGIEGSADAALLAARYGKPAWFSGAAAAAMAAVLRPHLPPRLLDVLADTAQRFEALPRLPELLVFGHGDLHGFNMAVVEDTIGPRLAGAFDLGNAGVLDVHEDFFRLNLMSEDLLARTVDRYRQLTAARPAIDRSRIEVYYRAFLYYLMDEWVRGCRWDDVAHIRGMIERHLRPAAGGREDARGGPMPASA
jgi:aminoglycoside phosphotransferase